jgi:flagellin
MSTINTNINSLHIQGALTKNQRDMTVTMERLATGRRINKASDDAAGLSISEGMGAQIRGLGAAARNANDAISMLQTADGGMASQSDALQRMRELAVLSRTDTYSSAQKLALNTEFTALRDQITTVATSTQWNGTNLLSGSTVSFEFQVGANAGDTLDVALVSGTLVGYGLSATMAISTAANASAALSMIDLALSALNTSRSTVGSVINRLTYAVDNLNNSIQNASESRSKIADTDYANATSDLARQQIIQQAGTAMLAQANQMPAMVLALLK